MERPIKHAFEINLMSVLQQCFSQVKMVIDIIIIQTSLTQCIAIATIRY